MRDRPPWRLASRPYFRARHKGSGSTGTPACAGLCTSLEHRQECLCYLTRGNSDREHDSPPASRLASKRQQAAAFQNSAPSTRKVVSFSRTGRKAGVTPGAVSDVAPGFGPAPAVPGAPADRLRIDPGQWDGCLALPPEARIAFQPGRRRARPPSLISRFQGRNFSEREESGVTADPLRCEGDVMYRVLYIWVLLTYQI
jgi:hypothetical protein